MTSANVTDFTIRDHSGKIVHRHSQHCMCKTHWAVLLAFQPLENHTIQQSWYDEEEELHMLEPRNLHDFMVELCEKRISLAKHWAKGDATKMEKALDGFTNGEYLPADKEAYRAEFRRFIQKIADAKNN